MRYVTIADSKIFYVAVIGGLWKLNHQRADDARSTARTIGKQLAEAGFGLVVYLSNEHSLEPHVVSGYVDALPREFAGKGQIRVRYASSQRGQVRFAEEDKHQDLFAHSAFPGDDWEAPFYRSLAEEEGVDAVLLLAGETSTFIAGQIALARQLPILAVAEYGGAAEKIWKQLAHASPNGTAPAWSTQTSSETVHTLEKRCGEIEKRRRSIRDHQKFYAIMSSLFCRLAVFTASFLALMGTLYFGVVDPPQPTEYPIVMFAGLIMAGASGALVRLILWDSESGGPVKSFLLGAFAGLLVGIAYLIPQWIGAPGPLAPNASVITETDKIQFISSLLVAVPAGIGFDTVVSRLKKQAETSPISPP